VKINQLEEASRKTMKLISQISTEQYCQIRT